jgi:hypothetical protein
MDDVTQLFTTYRECVRHLWNTYFQPVAASASDWDIRDEFDAIARSIFSTLVLRPLDDFEHELSPASAERPVVLPGFRVVPIPDSGVPILINRDMPRRGYWDHPVSRIRPAEVELHLIRFFDFDELGFRDWRYYEVFIHSSATYPDTVGRAALIECKHATVLFSKT